MWLISLRRVCQFRALYYQHVRSSFVLRYFRFLRATEETALARLSHRNSVCLSVCPSHGWIRQKRCKL